MIESFLRQSHLDTPSRIVFAATTAVFWLVYFAFGYCVEYGYTFRNLFQSLRRQGR